MYFEHCHNIAVIKPSEREKKNYFFFEAHLNILVLFKKILFVIVNVFPLNEDEVDNHLKN